MTKMDVREVVGDSILLTLIAAEHSAPGEPGGVSQAFKRLEATRQGVPPETPYEVEVRINGVLLDFRDWTKKVYAQLDYMVARAAADLLKERVDGKVRERLWSV